MIVLLCWGHQSNLLVGDYLVLPDYMKAVSRALDVIKWFNNHRTALDLFNAEQLTTYRQSTRPLTLTLLLLPPCRLQFSRHQKPTVMLLYSDIISGDEMFSDAFPMYAHTVLCAGVMD